MTLYPRDQYLTILQAAAESGETRFGREAALAWLAAFPGDLQVNLLYARLLAAEKRFPQALAVLENTCGADPEFLEAARLMLRMEQQAEGRFRGETLAAVLALGGDTTPETVATWGRNLWLARQALKDRALDKADSLICLALAADPAAPLVAVSHLQVLEANPDTPLAAKLSLGELYHQRYPGCVTVIILLADWLMQNGDHERAVSLLHQAAILDVGGQTAIRVWGSEHPYRAMWPSGLEVNLVSAIPAGVASILGWNRLTGGKDLSFPIEVPAPSTPQAQVPSAAPGSKRATESYAQLSAADSEAGTFSIHPERASTALGMQPEPAGTGISRRMPDDPAGPEAAETPKEPGEAIPHKPQRGPVYVVLSTNQGLVRQYGPQGASMVRSALNETARTLNTRPGWKAMVFMPDEAQFMAQIGMKPVNPSDAWQLKLSLMDLEQALKQKNLRIGAVLIAGGPEVVPFHYLPNPVDDDDLTVPSDSPYASSDENYFVPEWPVGRLPGGCGDDPALLLGGLSRIRLTHSGTAPELNWSQRLWNWLRRVFGFLNNSSANRRNSLALTAEIWRKASLAVYQPVGTAQSLFISPPVDLAYGHSDSTRVVIPLPSARLAYFNLHGLPDSPDWYGHRDPSSVESGESKDYPVALRPQDAAATSSSPFDIIFSEACYGGHVLEKLPAQAMVLRFLQAGVRAIAASTCISYGSISTPLVAADLLGNAFWKLVRAGKPAGIALQEAKIQLVHEMHARQGYLDGEDQKTLISFVLYGDPLATSPEAAQGGKQGQAGLPLPILDDEPLETPAVVKTVCDRSDEVEVPQPELMTYVKRVVEQYLPGMEGADVTLSHEHAHCSGEHACPTGHMKSAAPPDEPSNRRLVLLSKPILQGEVVHHQYARLTLDAAGKLVKLAVSR